jgi:hypothetical protein
MTMFLRPPAHWAQGLFLIGFGFLVGIFSVAGCGKEGVGVGAQVISGPTLNDTMTYHASFPSSEISTIGSATGFAADGRVILNTGTLAGSSAQSGFITVPVVPVDNAGTFLSARVTFNVTDPAHVAQVILGSPSASVAADYFGFRTAGPSLRGVFGFSANSPLSVDLGTTLSANSTLNLLAIRRAASVDFYVNGALKGSLPISGAASAPTAPYSIAVSNQSAGSATNASLTVSFLTIGTPM